LGYAKKNAKPVKMITFAAHYAGFNEYKENCSHITDSGYQFNRFSSLHLSSFMAASRPAEDQRHRFIGNHEKDP
jgi:hypothetical protein